MHLYDVPIIFVLVGVALYTVLAGADFGAGLWQLLAGGGPSGTRIRDHAHRSMGPVWEANHVWLIFVLTVTWTAYPTAFGAIASTLSIPLFSAAVGIILRGAAYALRAGTSIPRELRAIDTVFAVSSILTPFALGTMVGAVASGRVPVGNATGHLFSSWTGSTSILIGVLAVASCGYLAAVYLAADAARLREADLERRFRGRALRAGIVAGAVALGGLAVLHSDAHRVYHGLVQGDGLAALVVSVLAGLATLVLVFARRYEAARYSAGVAVAAVIAGWALAQNPTFLPGLTIQQAAAPHSVLIAIVASVLAGAVIVFPSLALLFRLVLVGRLDSGETIPSGARAGPSILSASASGLLGRMATGCLLAGVGLLTLAEAAWAHGVGVTALLAYVVLGFLAAAPHQLAAAAQPDDGAPARAAPQSTRDRRSC
jgi:cytochrome bd ubiquinol oxidase subunit II